MKRNKIKETMQKISKVQTITKSKLSKLNIPFKEQLNSQLNSKTALLLYKLTRRLVVLVIGLSLLLVGIALIFLPGPAIIIIPLSLVILSTEFIWARRFLKNVKEKFGLSKERAAAAVKSNDVKSDDVKSNEIEEK
ncbi:MAG: PGPGW domain-containing protein [Nanoarchaeota archaeon]